MSGAANFEWNSATVACSVALFLLAGLAEIGGGWLVWKSVRENGPWWWAAAGSAVLIGYGFVPTLQPLDDFGRLYAVYGGVFIALSYAWGAYFDGFQLDAGDYVGSAVALAGVAITLFWPRSVGAADALQRDAQFLVLDERRNRDDDAGGWQD